MSEKHAIIIGAGPGGLTAAMILAWRGFKVSLFEQKSFVGGRNSEIRLGPYSFDAGPTFLMMSFVLREMFGLAGRKAEDYLTFKKLEPMYKLSYDDIEFWPSNDDQKLQEQIDRYFPGNAHAVANFDKREKVRFDRMYPCLKKDYSSFMEFFSKPFLRALPHLAIGKSLYDVLGDYFKQDKLKISFTFQAKYLGMSPWECPGAFAIIPYIEHVFGVDHIQGGLNKISDAMAHVAREHGAQIHLSTPVKKVLTKGRTAIGVELANGEKIMSDVVVMGADFGHAMQNLFDPQDVRKFTSKKLSTMKFSCSTFMLYLGLDKTYNEPHHNIIFSGNYKKNIKEIVSGIALSDDMSVYVRNANATDSTISPAGHSALYVLVPVPNNRSKFVWDDNLVQGYREKVLDLIVKRTSMKDIRSHIVREKIISPLDWERDYSLYIGSTFNLGHNLSQMLYFRPRNRFEEFKNTYLVGGGTHPGSGLPTIYESARISANLICKDLAT